MRRRPRPRGGFGNCSPRFNRPAHCNREPRVMVRRPTNPQAELPTARGPFSRRRHAGQCKTGTMARGIQERRRNSATKPLTIEQILRWADAFHERTGRWPVFRSRAVPEAPGETWGEINHALRAAGRGLPGGGSLAKLLLRERSVPLPRPWRPRLSVKQILAWADAHRRRTGRWPIEKGGSIPGSAGGTWLAVDRALQGNKHGLHVGLSLARFLAQHRDKYYRWGLPKLTVRQILSWADAHFARHGRWPTTRESGLISVSPRESWQSVDSALRTGRCRLRERIGLTRFLAAKGRGSVRRLQKSPLTVGQVLEWARRHHRANGRWPNTMAGAVRGAPGESWRGIDLALRKGHRGLAGGSCLRELLLKEAGAAIHGWHAELSIRQIRSWAKSYSRRTGTRPSAQSGRIPEAPGETWSAVNAALRVGLRGLPRGTTLVRLLSDLPSPFQAKRARLRDQPV